MYLRISHGLTFLSLIVVAIASTTYHNIEFHKPRSIQEPKRTEDIYKKPVPPAKDCIKAVIDLNEISQDYAIGVQNYRCMGCEPVQYPCPDGSSAPGEKNCQSLIDKLFLKCDGVTLPDGFYYDFERTITGPFFTPESKGSNKKKEGSDDSKSETQIALTKQIERCGCVGSPGEAAKAGMLVLSIMTVGVLSTCF